MAIDFITVDWDTVPYTEHAGEQGIARWRTMQFAGLRVRVVDYPPGYLADHWCKKGHIVYCLEGSFTSEMETGEEYHLSKGMSYIVSDDRSVHRSRTDEGVRLLIIDGEFLAEH